MKPIAFALLITSLTLSNGSLADDLSDLTAASDDIVAKLNARNVNAVADYFPDERVLFGPDSPLLVSQTRDAFKSNFKSFFEGVEVYSWQLVDREVRVYGSTGVTAGHVVLNVQLKGDPVLRTSTFRQTSTWSKVNGKWLLVSAHASWHPSGEPRF